MVKQVETERPSEVPAAKKLKHTHRKPSQTAQQADFRPELPVQFLKSEEPTSKLTLVFELDEVLALASVFPVTHTTSEVQYTSPEGFFKFFVAFRPGLMDFFAFVKQHFELVLFTSATQEYAEACLQKLDPTLFERRFYRSDCEAKGKTFVKNLKVLNRPLSQVILLETFSTRPSTAEDNILRVKPWNGDPDDRTLLYLMYFFSKLEEVNDVRPAVAQFRQIALQTALL